MILHKEPWYDGIDLEIVNGEDIMLSYKNNSKVSSCMSNSERWKRAAFWVNVPGLSLIRAMRDNVLLLRALIWTATDADNGDVIRYLDRIYANAYPFDFCPKHLQVESVDGIRSAFTAKWQEFADVRSSERKLVADVVITKATKEYPMADTFKWLSADFKKISNRYIDRSYDLHDHEYGRLGKLY